MKYRTTKREVNNGYTYKICIGYCNLQYLLTYESPVAYTARREGWGADIYEINENTAIITGYAPFGNIRPKYDIQKEYDTAEKILHDYSLTYEEKKIRITELLYIFVEEVTQ